MPGKVNHRELASTGMPRGDGTAASARVEGQATAGRVRASSRSRIASHVAREPSGPQSHLDLPKCSYALSSSSGAHSVGMSAQTCC
jgi:hypothetical protein